MSARAMSPPGESARAGLATVAIMAGTVTAHSWAGGDLPSLPWLGGVCALVLAATRLVFRGQVSGRVMAVALGSAQFALHLLLTSMPAQSTHHMAHMSESQGHLDLSMSWQMAVAHLLSAVLTVVVWSATARALADISLVPGQPHLAVSVRRTGLVAGAVIVVRSVAYWRSGAPRRGPPRVVSPRYA